MKTVPKVAISKPTHGSRTSQFTRSIDTQTPEPAPVVNLRDLFQSYAKRVGTFIHRPPAKLTQSDFNRAILTASSPPESYEELPDFAAFETPQNKKDSFVALQNCEGYVTDISQDGFGARLTDFQTGDREDAFFPMKLVSSGDKPLLEVGAFFYWSTGSLRDRTGQIDISSVLRFKRIPGPTDIEFQKAKDAAHTLSEKIGIIPPNSGYSSTVGS